ncbi:major facilitator superfamily domain-containing protein [Tricladium varicosporioides]|nr:major facilitator superfamily domain-containing protein [Hymenoscyphus varicosporioides]
MDDDLDMEATKVGVETLAHIKCESTPEALTNVTEEKINTESVPNSELEPISHYQSPKDWPCTKKWTATLILSAFAFLQPLAETMLAPVEAQISRDLRISRAYDWLLINSLILIGVGLSPLLLAPLSEVYGRKPILVIGSTVFVIWNTGCGAAKTVSQIIAFRLLSGFGASVADATAGGVLSDLWQAEDRGKAFAIYMAMPLFGPALGPICGAFISEGIDWRWVFWITSITSAVVIVVAIVFFCETYEPRLEQLRNRTGNTGRKNPSEVLAKVGPFVDLMRTNLQRPFRMLGTQVIIQILAVYMALLYGTMFLFLFMYPRMWTEKYNQSIRIGSLNYISFAIGLIAGVNVAGPLSDYVYTRLKFRNDGIGRPEFRVPPMAIGTTLVPIGLLWWGWSGGARLHWIVPNLGSLIFAMGVYICSGCVSVYTIDAYTRYSASAISTNLVARSLTAALFPLFAPYMFDKLGFGLGATVLAGGFALFGTAVVLILWFYGENLRARSRYCATSNEA